MTWRTELSMIHIASDTARSLMETAQAKCNRLDMD